MEKNLRYIEQLCFGNEGINKPRQSPLSVIFPFHLSMELDKDTNLFAILMFADGKSVEMVESAKDRGVFIDSSFETSLQC